MDEQRAWGEAIGWLLRRLDTRENDVPPPEVAPLTRVAELFDLTPFERNILLVCAAAEIDGAISAACGGTFPSVGLTLGLLDGAHLSAFAPTATLRKHRLVELGPGPLAASAVRIDERVLYYLLGVDTIDVRLTTLVRRAESRALPRSQQDHADRLSSIWAPSGVRALVQLAGASGEARRTIANTAWSQHGAIWLLRANDLFVHSDRELLAALCEREQTLSGAGFVVEIDDHDPPDVQRCAALYVERCTAVVAISARDPIRIAAPWLRIDIAMPTPAERRARWTELTAATPLSPEAVARIALEFDADAVAHLGVHASSCAAADFERRLVETCSAQSRYALEELAQRIEPDAGWEDLVLLPSTMELLRAIAAQVPQRVRVYEDWGLSRGGRGLGITALFAGPSGTGKTLAAEVIAKHLGVELYRIDLSRVVNKYIGETEKNLRRVFDAAEAGAAVLLFDEADALFGKRSEVKDSHDRYANIEVSYLLQRMESYRGLAILTTNARDALDQAFLRRLRFVVEFKFPDITERLELWRHVFPRSTPTTALDLDQLARLRVTGGNVRTIALNAAFLAASRDESVNHSHLYQAASFEYRKLGMSLTELEPLKK